MILYISMSNVVSVRFRQFLSRKLLYVIDLACKQTFEESVLLRFRCSGLDGARRNSWFWIKASYTLHTDTDRTFISTSLQE